MQMYAVVETIAIPAGGCTESTVESGDGVPLNVTVSSVAALATSLFLCFVP